MSERSIIFLDKAELIGLTGRRMKSRQIEWLTSAGLYHFVNAGGHPIVARSVYEAWKNPPPPPAPQPPVCTPPPRPAWRDTPLGRWQAEQRPYLAQREADAVRMAALAKANWEATSIEREKQQRLQRAALVRFHANRRRVIKLQRSPAWADQEAMRAVYLEAQRLTRDTGQPHHVDHIIPLQGELVSGLHVENNLQILTATENSRKRNRYEVAA